MHAKQAILRPKPAGSIMLHLLGSAAAALYDHGNAYRRGNGVQEDKAKAAEFFKKVAMQGHTHGRYNLGCYKWDKGNSNCAVRHFLLISAKMGHLK